METLSAVSSKNTDPKSVRGGRPKNHPGDMKLMWYLASLPATSWQWILDLRAGPKHGGALLLAMCPEHPHPAAWLTGRLLGHASWDL